MNISLCFQDFSSSAEEHTIMSKVHLHFKRLELVGDVGLHLPSHLLPSPLLDPVELLVDIHFRGGILLSMYVWFGRYLN
jgi:hypothetical protein